MLIMLPRLALVVVRMYFSVFANVSPAFLDAAADDVEVALEQHEVGASRATSTACSTERLVSAACMAGASLTPSPRKPTTCPIFFSDRMIRSF